MMKILLSFQNRIQLDQNLPNIFIFFHKVQNSGQRVSCIVNNQIKKKNQNTEFQLKIELKYNTKKIVERKKNQLLLSINSTKCPTFTNLLCHMMKIDNVLIHTHNPLQLIKFLMKIDPLVKRTLKPRKIISLFPTLLQQIFKIANLHKSIKMSFQFTKKWKIKK
ncbi:hypothetical protein TTHERM_000933319 (macronuclear) [Tetrahymena thermophila SB210]|uniref:Uncharacterized protein n=1 Tax=Tetrahymena thermophila (strain SB210) TaxID=312017 RepID=W7X647_TETTS|nr:hypothetical protein TTHERM_000933319 [Tetrahymena thermophila SB210]EWS72872.1 hypothetical protein TTHERM_000933319 [Tetrahymena thermophila SB210]|eukprot:XP_012654600.1 hypothetical protein TTHERM_000933319 [Tetrahymena thermophila SB210]